MHVNVILILYLNLHFSEKPRWIFPTDHGFVDLPANNSIKLKLLHSQSTSIILLFLKEL